ncbi:MAG: type II secretion system protein [Undibacterium sp.]|nr:type II secretion system protein [Undibacterium sp.]
MSINRMRGVTLIELIMFMLIISIAIIGITRIMNLTGVASADPILEKQALAIAESMLDEIELQAFTICDPDDANVAIAQAGTDCGGAPQISIASVPTSTAGETRTGNPRFDHVADYNGLDLTGITDLQGVAIPGLQTYRVRVSEVANPVGDEIRIDVRVTNTANPVDVSLTGYRYRYAPRSVP